MALWPISSLYNVERQLNYGNKESKMPFKTDVHIAEYRLKH
jgi:hypothetical protein